MLLAVLLTLSFFAGILYDRWSLRLSAKRIRGHYYCNNEGIFFDDTVRKELRVSAYREMPLLLASLAGVWVLYVRPAWLISSGLLLLCAVVVLFSAGIFVSGLIRVFMHLVG